MKAGFGATWAANLTRIPAGDPVVIGATSVRIFRTGGPAAGTYSALALSAALAYSAVLAYSALALSAALAASRPAMSTLSPNSKRSSPSGPVIAGAMAVSTGYLSAGSEA